MRRGILVLGLVAIALAMPSNAAAGPQPRHPEAQAPNTSGTVYLGKADGYDLTLYNPSPDVVLLYVERLEDGGGDTGQGFSGTAYAVRPQKSLASGMLRADFGPIGRVSLRFKPGKSKTGRLDKQCHGKAPRTEDGSFRGSVALRGESDYFQLKTREAAGSRTHSFRLICAPGRAQNTARHPLYEYVKPSLGFSVSSAGGSIALLQAVSTGDRDVYLRAAHMQSTEAGAEVEVGAVERHRGMAIGHSASVQGGVGTLRSTLPGQHPASAVLAPPAPFHGEGQFVENSPTSHSWTGTLAVSFPGLDLPLTGPDFSTGLCVRSPFKSPTPCDFTPPPLVAE